MAACPVVVRFLPYADRTMKGMGPSEELVAL